MNKKRTLIIIAFILIFIFLVFIDRHGEYFKNKVQGDVENHASVVAPSVWTLFTPVTENYLSLSAKNNNYKYLVIRSLGDVEMISFSTDLRGFEQTLFKFGLITVESHVAPVVYKDQQIGEIEIKVYNKNIYFYTNIFILLLLVFLSICFVLTIVEERKNLKLRVIEKTAELASNNQILHAEVVERKRNEVALRESQQTFLTLFDHSFQFIALLDPDCRVVKINQTALMFRNLTSADVVDKFFWDTPWWNHSKELVQQLKEAYAIASIGEVARFEAHSRGAQEIYLDVSLKPVCNDEGLLIFIVAEARDVTDVRRAEQELQQAQKMESVGTLAGGIAHDFNNILGGILGTLTLLRLKRDKGRPASEENLYRHLDTVTETAMRAKIIVDQLLTLSRKHDLQLNFIDLNEILIRVCQIAKNSFDKSICIEVENDRSIPIYADANSLEQVFLNLCINAAHAMTIMRAPGEPWGGTLRISLDKSFQEVAVNHPAGEYWRITIEDNGVGMEASTLERIFVPFFTTKEKGSGSGLGLAMVYNIIKNHRGFIDVDSQPQSGTKFHVYLPVSEQPAEVASGSKNIEILETGTGGVLIIDDEELIRNNAQAILSDCGYEVLIAEHGEAGVALYRERREDIDVVLLDLIMPVMDGKETYRLLREIDPEVKVLLSSGFRQDCRVEEILATGANGFIQKPYSLYTLSSSIKDVLNGVNCQHG